MNGEKLTLALDETLPEKLADLLDEVHEEMYQKALKFRDEPVSYTHLDVYKRQVSRTFNGILVIPKSCDTH